MYLLRKFAGNGFERINSIIESYNNTQNNTINLLACVCYIFPEVTHAISFPFSTLPTEGLITNRYFPASEYMNEIENTSEKLVLKLFKIEKGYKVNIQPHSGTQANHIVYNAILKNNDNVICFATKDGGHISHSKFANGTIRVSHFKIGSNFYLDYDKIETIVKQTKPKLIIAGFSSNPREINFMKLSIIAKKYNSYLLADISHTAIFIMGGIFKTIFPYVDFATFTMEKNLRGPHGGIIVYKEEFNPLISYSTFPVSQGGPIQNMLFGKLVALELLSKMNLFLYASNIISNARLISKTLLDKGCDVITEGTDCHIVLVNVEKHNITGFNAEKLFEKNRILVNRNLVPNDKESPLITSGIRIGSTTITNLNYSIEDTTILSNIITNIIVHKKTSNLDLLYLLNKYHRHINTSNEETN